MKVTKTTIQNIFPNCARVEQVKSKQLFVIYYPSYSLLVSYRTIIGFKEHGSLDNKWKITTKKYSQTTSCQITYFHRHVNYNTEYVEESVLRDLIKQYGA